MEKRHSELRQRIERTDRDQSGRGIFPAELRAEIVALAQAWSRGGKSRSSLARRLGLNPATLAYWLPRDEPPAATPLQKVRIRPVQLVEAPAPAPSTERERTVLLPSGARIEGLSWPEVLELARALG